MFVHSKEHGRPRSCLREKNAKRGLGGEGRCSEKMELSDVVMRRSSLYLPVRGCNVIGGSIA